VLCKTVTLRLSAKGREIIMINAKKN
jgi:hypothetical protein